MIVSETEEVIPSQRRIKMYFDRQSFHKSIKGYFVFLWTILNQNWSGEFFGILDDLKLISARGWRGFGNFLGQFWNWYKYKFSDIAELFIFGAMWFIWVLVVVTIRAVGILLKMLIWLFFLSLVC